MSKLLRNWAYIVVRQVCLFLPTLRRRGGGASQTILPQPQTGLAHPMEEEAEEAGRPALVTGRATKKRKLLSAGEGS